MPVVLPTLVLFWLMTTSAGNFSEEDFVDTSPLMLRGTPETDASKVQVSFQVWANPGKSALRPRKQDLHESNLLKLLGTDYDHRWMRTNKDKPNTNVSRLSSRLFLLCKNCVAVALTRKLQVGKVIRP